MPSPSPAPALLDLADSELNALSRTLRELPRSEWYPASALVYQPVPHDDHPDGRLVDVAPRPVGSLGGTIFQPLSAGLTGEFFARSDSGDLFQPFSQQINDDAIRSYGTMAHEHRLRQVTLERLRYPDLAWTDLALPPIGQFIHQVPLAPGVVGLDLLRFPVFGLVYTLTPTEAQTSAVRHLIHVSQYMSAIVLDERLHTLWGSGLPLALKSAIDPSRGGGGLEFPELVRLCMVFLLSHHWFYPHKPAAWRALTAVAGRPCEDAYHKRGWLPPTPALRIQGQMEPNWQAAVGQDLYHIARQICGPVRAPREIKDLSKAMSTAAALVAGRPAWAHYKHGTGTVELRPEPMRDAHVTILPAPHEATFECALPLFPMKQVKENIRKRVDDPAWLDQLRAMVSPGCPPCDVRTGTMQPDAWIERVEGGRATVRPCHPKGIDAGLRWLWLYGRVVVEDALQCASAFGDIGVASFDVRPSSSQGDPG